MKELKFFWLLISSLIIIFLDLATFLNPLKDLSFRISSPLSTGVYQMGLSFSEIIQKVHSVKTLQLENEHLLEEVNILKAEKARIYILQSENEALRKQLNCESQEDFELLIGNIIKRNLSNFATGIFIDKGGQDRILEGMPIIFQNSLVGYIKDIEPKRSEIVFITDAQSKIPVSVYHKDKVVDGILKGQFNSGLKVEEIFQEDEIFKGDLVFTSGLSGRFPKGLLIGEIEEVIKSDTEVFKSARVKQVVDLRKLETVFIILSWNR